MKKTFSWSILLVALMFLNSCSKKTIPEETVTVSDSKTNTVPAPTVATTAPETKAVSAKEYSTGKRKVGGTTKPKFIIVDDRNAKSTADGKLYYDLGGFRYWKNNKDGKYYLDGIFSSVSDKKKKRTSN